jgi:hypothetical protein
MVAPFTSMLAPGRGFPSSPVTLPEMDLSKKFVIFGKFSRTPEVIPPDEALAPAAVEITHTNTSKVTLRMFCNSSFIILKVKGRKFNNNGLRATNRFYV